MNLLRSRHVSSKTRDVLLFACTLVALTWALTHATQGLGYHWKWYRIPRYIYTIRSTRFVAGPFLKGLLITLKISGISLVLATFLGLSTALCRQTSSFAAQLFARLYVEIIRNTPLLTQLFFLYYVVAPVLNFGATLSAILALSLFEGAYASEIFRAGIQSIDRGQWEAAYSLGLSTVDLYRTIILPQAIRSVLPPLTGVAVSLIKDSSLASTIALYELTQSGNVVSSDTFMVFEVWFTVALIYLCLTIPLSLLSSRLEHHERTVSSS